MNDDIHVCGDETIERIVIQDKYGNKTAVPALASKDYEDAYKIRGCIASQPVP